MNRQYILGIDQSTQATKAILVDQDGKVTARCGLPHRQIVNDEGWVEHDPEEIWENTLGVIKTLIQENHLSAQDIRQIAICNQRETACVWNRETGKPVYNAVVWQCSRGKAISARLEEKGLAPKVKERSGMQLSPYFSAAKIAWILENVPGVKGLNDAGKLCIGTMDAFLVWRLTGGEVFRTDYSNAARTQLFNIHTLSWDEELCGMFGVNPACLPEVADSDGFYGETDAEGAFEKKIPIVGVMGDSNGALYGEGCYKSGMVKATYGTGSSIMMNIGTKPVIGENPGTVTSIAWGLGGQVEYVLEGNINYSAAVVRWLEKDLHLIAGAAETGELAEQANPADTTYIVPAFSGLGAPYWDNDAEGMVCGMTRLTGKAEFVRAALDCIDYQITDILRIMEETASVRVEELHTDGGATRNKYLMQFQSDIMNCTVTASREEEVSLLGPVFAGGLKTGFFTNVEGFVEKSVYTPDMDSGVREKKLAGWKKAVSRCLFKG